MTLKSYENSLLLVLRGLLTDAARFYPADSTEFERDFARIHKNVEARGLGVLTLELPALCKHLDRCLDNALWVEPHMSLSRRQGPNSTVPRLFARLWNRVFDNIGMLRSDVDTTALALLRQLMLFAKKVKLECSADKVFEALSDFYAVEAAIPRPSLDWNGREFDGAQAKFLSLAERVGFDPIRGQLPLEDGREPIRRSLLEVIQQVADHLAWVLGPFDPYDHDPKHGPGAVADLRKGEFKYDFPSWSARLDTVFPYADFAFANSGVWADSVAKDPHLPEQEAASRLIVVPKTQKAPRLIAAEPVSHQWCQQVIWSYFQSRYRRGLIGNSGCSLRDFVSFDDQTGNQVLARSASVAGSHWTVDLSSASDRLSCRVVERIFRRNPALLNALYSSRTRYLCQDIDQRCPRIVRLQKFSTMGSACTFPVQSHVFLCIAIGSTLYGEGSKVTAESIGALAGQVRVFGDDIIIPRRGGSYLLEALGYLGFKVNESKTYGNGRFRESCGLEAYAGVEITPAYFLRPTERTSPESIASCVASSNNFFHKGWWAAAAAIEKTVPREYPIPVVGVSSGLLGYTSYCGPNVLPLKKRWNAKLQREEVQIARLTSRVDKRDVSSMGQLLQFFTERPDPTLKWESGATGRPRLSFQRGWVEMNSLGDQPK